MSPRNQTLIAAETMSPSGLEPVDIARASGAVAVRSEQGETPDTQLHFVYWEHTGYADEIVRAIDDADVVAFEFIVSEETHDQLEGEANHATSTTGEADVPAITDLNPLMGEIIGRLSGSGKQIRFIDITLEQYDAIDEFDYAEAREAYDTMFTEPTSVTRARAVKQAASFSRETRAREAVVNDQIDALVRDNPGKKIAVVQGALHTPTYFVKRESHVTMSREFVPAVPGRQRARFDQRNMLETAIRSLNMLPDKPLSPRLSDAITMEAYIEALDKGSLGDYDFTPAQVSEMLHKVDDIVANNAEASNSERRELVRSYIMAMINLSKTK